MKIYIYDIEVYSHDWIVVFRNIESDNYIVMHNDNYRLKEFLNQPDILIGGFNSKHYDDWVILTMLNGGSNYIVKKHSDFIVKDHRNGWEFPFIQYQRKPFYAFDLRDDTYKGLSLKSIEGHLGKSIVECDVPFDIDRKLTEQELNEVIDYCKTDVGNTLEFFRVRKNYIDCKINLGEMSDLKIHQSLPLTNAKLTAKFLEAKRVERNDGRDYIYPGNLKKEIIPKEILDFFNQIRDLSIPDDELFKKKLKIIIAGCPCVYAWGGVHGSLKKVIFESTDDIVVQNRDVESLYPSLLIEYNYVSRNIPDPDKYRRTKDARIKAKHSGDKVMAQTLKNPLNVMSGAQESYYNDLYDPRNTRSMRITGQLLMTQLVMEIIKECKSFKLINFNTDGFMYTVNRNELEVIDGICKEWEKNTRLNLETDDIKKVTIKDVNNLIFKKTSGEVKKVGSYLNYGISEKGAFNINNNYVIVKKAIANYLTNDILPEHTIHECNEILEFQNIATTGSTYIKAVHMIDGKPVGVQKVNRVYATKDSRYGTIKKIKKNGQEDKVASIPEHCIIDNDNTLTIDHVDKQFYIDLAYKMIGDYLGYEPERKNYKKTEEYKIMAETKKTVKTMNVYEKLIKARLEFLKANVKKTGINRFAEFKYYELADIIPPATKIFNDLGLVFITTFDERSAIGELYNTENYDECIEFRSPIRELTVISATGKSKMNELQGLGAEQTYQRRYLYMMCLDIVEADTFDATSGDDTEKTKSKKSNKPGTPKEREEVKKELIDESGEATEVQIKSIKTGLKKLRSKDSEKYEGYVTQVVKKIKAGLNKTDAENLLIEIGNKIEE